MPTFHSWQDIVVAISNIFFFVTLVMMLLNRDTQVPRHSSIPTAMALTAMSITFATLSLTYSCSVMGVNALLWYAIAIWRPTRS